jgi:hypothetical protein
MTYKEFVEQVAPYFKYTECDVEDYEIVYFDEVNKRPYHVIIDSIEVNSRLQRIVLNHSQIRPLEENKETETHYFGDNLID